jgi:hypothetical protein
MRVINQRLNVSFIFDDGSIALPTHVPAPAHGKHHASGGKMFRVELHKSVHKTPLDSYNVG